MKKRTINLSWPAQLSDFAKDTKQENFSRCKLKVFYKGETEDHRFFSDSFADKIVQTLPYTPVVSYYDKDADDFVGHATEQQIFGIVDPCTTPYTVEDENHKVWYVCDIVLYTERPDMVGEIASKIVGHEHSLELNPKDIEYKINYDERKHFKNIEFTAGSFIGLSVLGKNQKPAFAGSSFFSYDETFEAKMKLLKDYCEQKNDHIQQGGNQMDLKEFMTLSWGEIATKVEEKICQEYCDDAYTYIVDMYDDNAIVRFFYFLEGTQKLMKIKYSVTESGEIVFGDITEVHVTYEEIPSPENAEVGVETQMEADSTASSDAVCNPDDDKKKEDAVCNPDDEKEKENAVCNPDDEKKKEDAICDPDDRDDKDDDDDWDDDEDCKKKEKECSIADAEVTELEREVDDGNEEQTQKTDTSSASFTQSEQAEFEILKREKKLTLLNSYKDSLSEDEYNKFVGSIDSFDEKDLEIELLKAYKAFKEQEPKQRRVFAFTPILNAKNNSNDIDGFIKNNL